MPTTTAGTGDVGVSAAEAPATAVNRMPSSAHASRAAADGSPTGVGMGVRSAGGSGAERAADPRDKRQNAEDTRGECSRKSGVAAERRTDD